MIKNYFLLSMLFIVLSALLYAFFIKPQYYLGRFEYDNVTALQDVLIQGEELQKTRDILQDQINAIPQQKINLIENAIPKYSPENIALFLLALDGLVYTESGLPLNVSYSLGGERDSFDLVILPITFNLLTVDYDTLREFILNLQLWGRGVRIQSLQVGSPTDRDAAERGLVRATVVIEALFASVSEAL